MPIKVTFSSIILAMTLLTAGCSFLPYVEIDEELPTFVGKDISYAVKYLGYPDRKDSFEGRTMYVWEHSGVRTVTETNRTPVQSTSYTGYGVINTTSYQETTVSKPYSYDCKIRIFVDSRKRITETDIDNQRNGCNKYETKIAVIKQAERDQEKAEQKLKAQHDKAEGQ